MLINIIKKRNLVEQNLFTFGQAGPTTDYPVPLGTKPVRSPHAKYRTYYCPVEVSLPVMSMAVPTELASWLGRSSTRNLPSASDLVRLMLLMF